MAHAHASAALLRVLVQEQQLSAWLRSIKHYFLMDQVEIARGGKGTLGAGAPGAGALGRTQRARNEHDCCNARTDAEQQDNLFLGGPFVGDPLLGTPSSPPSSPPPPPSLVKDNPGMGQGAQPPAGGQEQWAAHDMWNEHDCCTALTGAEQQENPRHGTRSMGQPPAPQPPSKNPAGIQESNLRLIIHITFFRDPPSSPSSPPM